MPYASTYAPRPIVDAWYLLSLSMSGVALMKNESVLRAIGSVTGSVVLSGVESALSVRRHTAQTLSRKSFPVDRLYCEPAEAQTPSPSFPLDADQLPRAAPRCSYAPQGAREGATAASVGPVGVCVLSLIGRRQYPAQEVGNLLQR